MKSPKTDNADPTAKLELRRYFLAKYHTHDPPHVLDCCQGESLLWGELRREFELGSYWGVDLKRRKGRLQVDSARILGQPGWPQNVIDVDTYGSPWKHWAALLPNVTRPTTVFLTVGMVRFCNDALEVEALGLGALELPAGLPPKLHDLAIGRLLAMPLRHGLAIRAGRALAGLSQVDAAERAGMKQSDWSRLERHSSPAISLAMIMRVAESLGLHAIVTANRVRFVRPDSVAVSGPGAR